MGQVASSVGKLEAQMNGKFPFQALNPIENVNVIMMRSGKELEEKRSKQIEMEEEEQIETELSTKKEHPPPLQTKTSTTTPKVTPHSMNSSFKTIPQFPVSSSRSKKEDKKKEILEVFKKVELNIPLLDAIKQIPKYAKFLKELCTTKCVRQVFDLDCEDGLSVALSYGYDFTQIEEMERQIGVPQNMHESALALQALQTVPHGDVFVDLVLSYKKLLPSILQAPELELKPLPGNLKYVFIGDNNTLPVIIAKGLTSAQEEKLVKLLCDHKTAIGWTLADIKGISPSMCMHHILLEDNAKPIREMQRRLNSSMMEVVVAMSRSHKLITLASNTTHKIV
jgi:hypothetical protein